MKGFFISFEGPDGSGKTTQIQRVAARLQQLGYDVVVSREPGGTQVAEKVRAMVLDSELPLNDISEILLYLAARSEHVEKILRPAVMAGKIVLCDRFSDSTLVYQGLAKGKKYEDLQQLKKLNDFACQGFQPDLTVLLDGDVDTLLQRRNLRGVSDRYENKGTAFQQSIRAGFLEIAAHEADRIKIVNAEKDSESVEQAIFQEIDRLLQEVSHVE